MLNHCKGRVTGLLGLYQDRIPVELILKKTAGHRSTATSRRIAEIVQDDPTTDGCFEYRGMYAGIYVLNVGDKSVEFAAKLDEGSER